MASKFDPAEHYSEKTHRVYEAADVSRGPRPTALIFDLAAEYGATPESLVLDVGCANGGNTRELIRRTGCTVEGVDVLPWLVEMGRQQNEELGLGDQFQIRQGSILDIPFPDDHFDFVFCRDTLNLIGDVRTALAECRRVLKPGRAMLLYVTLATPRLCADELRDLEENLGNESSDETLMDTLVAQTFAVEQKVILGSEGVQEREEAGDHEATQNLLRIARLQTWRDDYIAEHGQRSYDIALADLKWQVFMLLGKLQATIYLLRRPT